MDQTQPVITTLDLAGAVLLQPGLSRPLTDEEMDAIKSELDERGYNIEVVTPQHPCDCGSCILFMVGPLAEDPATVADRYEDA